VLPVHALNPQSLKKGRTFSFEEGAMFRTQDGKKKKEKNELNVNSTVEIFSNCNCKNALEWFSSRLKHVKEITNELKV
jgi:hypothetical protein